jgi:16S rRNA processing protein RimM
MNKDDLYYIGKIVKPFGSKGHLLVFMDVDDPESYQDIRFIFVAIEEAFIPWPVISLEIRDNNQAILVLEEMNENENPSQFTGCEIYLPLSDQPSSKKKKLSPREIKGFTVVDQERGIVGTVSSVLQLPLHNVLQVHNGSKEILVPMGGEIIVAIDRKKKEILIHAPEGLLDLYL